MDAELEQQLISNCPTLYKFCQPDPDEVPNPTPPIVLDGVSCGDGWYPLLDALSELVETNVNDHDDRPTVHAVQIKQKWGRLRVYTNPMPELVYGAVRLAEELSDGICENCGTMQGVEQRTDDSGWQAALCPECSPPWSY